MSVYRFKVSFEDQKEIYLLFPTTFMNNSGLAVERAMQMYQIDIGSILVVADDVYIPFGEFRLISHIFC